MSNTAVIVNAITTLLVGTLGAVASLYGVRINSRLQDKRALYHNRSESVSKLFASINKAERSLMKVLLCLKSKTDIGETTQDLLASVKEISTEYDKSAIFFPTSIAQIVESILFTTSAATAIILMDKKQSDTLKAVSESLERLKTDKKDLRDVFQIMMGIKK